jgi:predicted neutral ceramidase superfamily lipid hydrolase
MLLSFHTRPRVQMCLPLSFNHSCESHIYLRSHFTSVFLPSLLSYFRHQSSLGLISLVPFYFQYFYLVSYSAFRISLPPVFLPSVKFYNRSFYLRSLSIFIHSTYTYIIPIYLRSFLPTVFSTFSLSRFRHVSGTQITCHLQKPI